MPYRQKDNKVTETGSNVGCRNAKRKAEAGILGKNVICRLWRCLAKGGGKTWFIQHKAVGGALQYPGIKILIMRAHYPE